MRQQQWMMTSSISTRWHDPSFAGSGQTAVLLRGEGWEALHVKEVGLDRAPDVEILEFVRNDNLVCVTLDHDFHAHLARAQMNAPSVIRLRLEGLPAIDQAALIRRVWDYCAQAISEGAAVTVDSKTIRVRRLPLR